MGGMPKNRLTFFNSLGGLVPPIGEKGSHVNATGCGSSPSLLAWQSPSQEDMSLTKK